MTCREKLAMEHPPAANSSENGGCAGCPHDWGYLPVPAQSCADCGDYECTECWNREIPEQPSSAEFLDKTMHIKDSGDRTLFDTGAVRDMREGKGRCDLMPLEVAAKLLTPDMDLNNNDLVIGNIALFKNTEFSTLYLYRALYYFSENYNSTPTMLLEVAKHFEEGAKKYGENNWQKGIPVHCYIDSAVRHYLKWLRGDKDEPHDRAFVWNLMCCIWEVDYHKEDGDGRAADT